MPESWVQAHWLTRVARSTAGLAGVGASFGIGIGTRVLGDKAAAFAANNAMALSARMVLLKCLFGCLVALPAIVAIIVAFQIDAPNRLRRFERVAAALSPLTGLGFIPLVFHSQIWKGKLELFLLANLCVTLLVWGSLKNLTLPPSGPARDWFTSALRRRVPIQVSRALPWSALVLAVVVAVLLGHKLANSVPALPIATGIAKAQPGLTTVGALMRLGHAGLLAVPFITKPYLIAPSPYGGVIAMSLTAGAALPLFAWARLHLGGPAGFLLALLYLAYPHLSVVGSSAPLPLGTAALFFFAAAYAYEKRHLVIALLLSVLLVAVHEQAALWLVCLGAYFCFQKPSPKGAWLLVLLPLGYFAWVALKLLPGLHIETYRAAYHGLWSTKESGILPALTALAENPAYGLLRLCGEREAIFWLEMLVPFALLPLYNSRWLLWLSPFIFFGVVSLGRFPRGDLTAMVNSHFIVLGYVASVLTLEEIRNRRRPGVGLWPALITWCFALTATVFQLGCLWLSPL